MNPQSISLNPEIREAIRCVHKRDWQAFFKSIKDSEMEAFTVTPPENLLMLQARVKVVEEFETLFKQISETEKHQ